MLGSSELSSGKRPPVQLKRSQDMSGRMRSNAAGLEEFVLLLRLGDFVLLLRLGDFVPRLRLIDIGA